MVNLFMEGTISKVKKEPTLQIPKWMKIGIEEESKLETLHEKLNHISKIVNEKLARIKLYKDWIELIDLVAEYKYTAMESNDTVYVEEANTLMMKVNQDFQDWMLKAISYFNKLASDSKAKDGSSCSACITCTKKKK